MCLYERMYKSRRTCSRIGSTYLERQDAVDYCSQLGPGGGYLVEIEGAAERDFLYNLVNGKFPTFTDRLTAKRGVPGTRLAC